MNKVLFTIPNNKNNNYVERELEVERETIIEYNNITNYVEIAPNVYSFNLYDSNVDNIYVLYNNACQLKKENKIDALEMFKRCVKLINNTTKREIVYEIFINLALLVSEIKGSSSSEEVGKYYEEALKIFSDRAEPYFYWSIYCNRIHHFEKAYYLLNKALLFSYEQARITYPETQFTAYGKYLYNELSIACYSLKKYDEAKLLLEKIIDDPDLVYFKESAKEKLENIIKNIN